MDFNHFKTQKIELGSYDLRSENIIKLAMFNNIDIIGMSLEIILNDKTDIKNKLPIKGGEILSIIFVDKYANKIKKDFILTNVVNLDNINEWNNVIQLSFITKESYILSTKRDYSYHNDTISNIIKKYTTFTDETPTTTMREVIIPGFTYTKAIQYMIANFTKSHLCFETNDGYLFSDIEDLIKPEETKSKDKISTKDQEENKKITKKEEIEAEETDYKYKIINDRSNLYGRYVVVSWNEIQVFNTINDGYKNIYDNTYVVYDPNNKTVKSSRKTIIEEQKEVVMLGSGDNYNEDIIENVNTKYGLKPYSENVLENSGNTYDLFNKKLEILINGDLNVQVGSVIEIEIGDKFNNNTNITTNGSYLVTKLAHHINQSEFMTKLEVSKNAYFKNKS